MLRICGGDGCCIVSVGCGGCAAACCFFDDDGPDEDATGDEVADGTSGFRFLLLPIRLPPSAGGREGRRDGQERRATDPRAGRVCQSAMEGINGDVTRDFSEVLLSRPGVLLFVQAIFGFTYDVGYLRSRPVDRGLLVQYIIAPPPPTSSPRGCGGARLPRRCGRARPADTFSGDCVRRITKKSNLMACAVFPPSPPCGQCVQLSSH